MPIQRFAITTAVVMAISLMPGLTAVAQKHSNGLTHHPTLRNEAIDNINIQWWDDDKSLLFIDITFNFPVSVTTEVSDKIQKTHILELATTGTVANSYRKSYVGTEHQVISKRFRDIIDEIRFEGGHNGKASLVVYMKEPVQVSYRELNDFRSIHLELSRLQSNPTSDQK